MMMDDLPLSHWTRAQLQSYLENRGFAVYDSEPTTVLMEAVRLDLEEVAKEGGC